MIGTMFRSIELLFLMYLTAQCQNYQVIDLGTLRGNQSIALGINAKGDIVGADYSTNGNQYAFLYANGSMKDLGLASGSASAINNSGQVVGSSYIGPFHYFAFLYDKGSVVNLASQGWRTSGAAAINDNGEVVGTYYPQDSNDQRAFLYSNGSSRDLGTPDGTSSEARAINNSGQVVGWTET